MTEDLTEIEPLQNSMPEPVYRQCQNVARVELGSLVCRDEDYQQAYHILILPCGLPSLSALLA
jgi:hypothetical protein